MKSRKFKAVRFVIFVLVVLLASLILMLLWNYVMPDVMGVVELSYGQAVALFLLSRLLFGNWMERKHRMGRAISKQSQNGERSCEQRKEYIRNYISKHS